MKHYPNPRVAKAQLFIFKMSQYLEIVCALVLIVAILIAFLTVPSDLYSLFLDNGFDLDDFIKKSFELVIGVELLKMFCRHDIDSVVEVLLFSVSRQIVIEHMPIKEGLIGILAVAVLFAIRRFLFVPVLDDPDKASQKLERDAYIHQRIAEAIAKYKKEAAAAAESLDSLEEKAKQGVHTAPVYELGSE